MEGHKNCPVLRLNREYDFSERLPSTEGLFKQSFLPCVAGNL